jgi:tyrosine-protein phosphatase YwqE
MSLPWFHHSRKNVCATLFAGMTDVHTHLLPGVDDGAQSLADSVEILCFMQEIGVEYIYLTPHIMTDLPGNTPDALQSRYEEFIKDVPSGL